MPSFPKPMRSATVDRRKKRSLLKRAEDAAMAKVRRRDKKCRFPLCGCRKLGLTLHVSHQRHRGMGGNPAGDRTVPELMVLVCSARHRELPISIDRGTVRWRPLTEDGANGPIAWDLNASLVRGYPLSSTESSDWFQIAEEIAPGVLIEPTANERSILVDDLAKMER